MAWTEGPCATPDPAAARRARQRQAQLTKPAGALGQLEALAIRLAALQGRDAPSLETLHISIFAADHGIAARGVSAYPSAVTAQMVQNFSAGGAAISVLARELGAALEVVDVGTLAPSGPLPRLIERRLGPGTADLSRTAAMSPAQRDAALEAGRDAARRAVAAGTQLFIGGEMGIGNTTAATALTAALLGLPPARLTGPGTGLDADALERKRELIATALTLHRHHLGHPGEALRRLGGFEIAALTGAYIACAQARLPALVDGFITAAAALTACRLNPGVRPWLLWSHCSAEPGQRAITESLGAEPLLELGLRLGEGSGAALAVPLLRLACALHNGMATFAEAGVSEA